jgi:hypothetical protein
MTRKKIYWKNKKRNFNWIFLNINLKSKKKFMVISKKILEIDNNIIRIIKTIVIRNKYFL